MTDRSKIRPSRAFVRIDKASSGKKSIEVDGLYAHIKLLNNENIYLHYWLELT